MYKFGLTFGFLLVKRRLKVRDVIYIPKNCHIALTKLSAWKMF